MVGEKKMKKHYSNIDKKYHILSDKQVVIMGLSGIIFGITFLIVMNA